MESRNARIAVVGLLIAAAVGLFVVLSDRDPDDGETGTDAAATATGGGQGTETAPREPRAEVITVRNGTPVGGIQRFSYETGETIRLEFRLDQTYEELHVHGYDITRHDVSGVQRLKFTADLEGIFEIEAHGPSGDVLLGELAVLPG